MSDKELKKGDKVVMHTCLESKGKNNGKIWTCRDDQFKSCSDHDVVFLEGFSGYFCCEFLQVVNVDTDLSTDKEA